MKTIKGCLHGQLIELGKVDAFVQFCGENPGREELRQWCRRAGVVPEFIPQSFKSIRQKLGCVGQKGGLRRPVNGRKPGAVTVYSRRAW